MLDIKFIRENPEKVQQNAFNKGYDVDIAKTLELDEKRKRAQVKIDNLRERRNQLAVQNKGQKPSEEAIAEGKKIRQELEKIEGQFNKIDQEFIGLLKKIPNMALDDVPVGLSEDENVIIKTVGEKPKFDFEPKNHAEIATQNGWLDKERAAKVTGSRFAYVMGDLAKLQMAIVQYVFELLSDEASLKKIIKDAGLSLSPQPFVPVLPPLMIRTEMYDAMDRLEPRDERYKLENDDLWLQGSAEHVLGSMHQGEIFEEAQLPIRYLGYASSFRREAGAYGKDMEGLFRMHQFDKLELESFTVAENGLEEHKLFIAIQDYMLTQLGLPHQVVKKCTFDIGKPNATGTDMDTWMPGQAKYRETHTADYMTDYQARRLNTRVRRTSGELELVHINDATAFALGRIMIAIIENYQTADGRVNIPVPLQKYLNNRTII